MAHASVVACAWLPAACAALAAAESVCSWLVARHHRAAGQLVHRALELRGERRDCAIARVILRWRRRRRVWRCIRNVSSARRKPRVRRRWRQYGQSARRHGGEVSRRRKRAMRRVAARARCEGVWMRRRRERIYSGYHAWTGAKWTSGCGLTARGVRVQAVWLAGGVCHSSGGGEGEYTLGNIGVHIWRFLSPRDTTNSSEDSRRRDANSINETQTIRE